MTGSTPFRKRLFRKRPMDGDDTPLVDGGRVDGVREDERGPRASLEATSPGESAVSTVRAADGKHGADGGSAPPAKAGRLTAVKEGVRRGGRGAKNGLGYLADRIIENAPRIPVRDLAALRKQFPGLGPEQIADKLVAGARNATSTVGAGVGAAAMLPVPPAMPAELAAEVTGVAAIELKLIAELHEVYGLRPEGNLKQRTTVYLTDWTEERGIDVTKPSTLNGALGGQMKRELRQQIMKRTVRNLPNLIPFLLGAAVGAWMNRRDTGKLAAKVRRDLRKHQVPWDALEGLPRLAPPAEPLELG